MRLLPVTMALAGLLAAAIWSVRLGCADYQIRQETLGGTERAIALTPDQSEYYARLAWLVSGDDPRKAEAALHRAVALNPWDARSWIELGLRAEAAGDDAAAQQCLLRAAGGSGPAVPAAMDAGELLFPARQCCDVLVLDQGRGGDGVR